MKNIYIVRHGQSDSNAGGEAMINATIPLSPLGHSQADGVADWLLTEITGDISSIGVSKYIRTHMTAQPLLDKTGIEATVIENLEEFNPLCFVQMDGLPLQDRTDMSKNYWAEGTPDYVHGADAPLTEQHTTETKAESFSTFTNRITKVLDHLKTLDDGTHVLFTHSTWIGMLIWKLLNLPVNSQSSMHNFRQFELAMCIENTEVFLLQIKDNELPAITKVRSLG